MISRNKQIEKVHSEIREDVMKAVFNYIFVYASSIIIELETSRETISVDMDARLTEIIKSDKVKLWA